MGANNDIVFRVRAEDAGMVRTFLSGAEALRATGRGADQTKSKFRALGDEGEKAGRRTKDAMGEAGRTINVTLGSATQDMAKLGAQFAGFGSVMAGLHTTVRMITAEYERYRELNGSARRDVSSYAKDLEAVKLQMNPGENIGQFEPEIRSALGAAGLGPEESHFALSTLKEMMSAKGNKPSGKQVTSAEVIALWKKMIKLYGPSGDWEGAEGVGQGLMDLYRTEENTDIDLMLGQAMATYGQSRTATSRAFGLYTLPTIAQLQKDGRVPRDKAIGLASALGFEMADPTGRVTRTAALTAIQRLPELAAASDIFNSKNLTEFVEKNADEQIRWIRGEWAYKDDAERRRADLFRANLLGGRSPDEADRKIALARAHRPGWTAQGTLQTEVRGEDALVSMLSKSDPKNIYKAVTENANVAKGTTDADARKRVDEYVKGENSEYARLRRADMAVQGAETELRLGQTERAWRGLATHAADVAMDATGKTAFGKRIDSIVAGATASQYSDSKAIEMIQDQLLEAEHNILERQPGDQWKFLRDPNAFYAEQYKKLPGPARKRVESLRAARRRLQSLQLQTPSIDVPVEGPRDGTVPIEPAAPTPATNDQSSATRELTNELAATRAEIAKLASSAAQVRGAQVSVTIDDGGAQAARRLLDRPHPMTSLYG